MAERGVYVCARLCARMPVAEEGWVGSSGINSFCGDGTECGPLLAAVCVCVPCCSQWQRPPSRLTLQIQSSSLGARTNWLRPILDVTSWLQVYDKHLSVCTDRDSGTLPPPPSAAALCWRISSIHTPDDDRTHTHWWRQMQHKCIHPGNNIWGHNGKKASEISSCPPFSSPPAHLSS